MNRQESIANKKHNYKNDPQKKHRLGMVSKNILPGGLNKFYGTNLTLIFAELDAEFHLGLH